MHLPANQNEDNILLANQNEDNILGNNLQHKQCHIQMIYTISYHKLLPR